jgi:hypothetical protein
MEGGRKSGVHDRVHADAERTIAPAAVCIFAVPLVDLLLELFYPPIQLSKVVE